MAKRVQRLGAPAAFTGLAREITVDAADWRLRLHDGVTAGGHAVAKKSETDAITAQLAENATELTALDDNLSSAIDFGSNLFDKSKAKLNTKFSGDTRQEESTANMAVTDHILVTAGETISFTNAISLVEVRTFTEPDDSAYKNRGTHTTDGGACSFVIPADVKSIRINFTNYDSNPTYNYIDRMMINRGVTLLPYEPYGKKTLKTDVEVKVGLITGLHTVATSGTYSDLNGKPSIDSKIIDDGTNSVSGKAVYDFVVYANGNAEMTRNIFDKSKVHTVGEYYFNTGLMEVELDTDYVCFNQVLLGGGSSKFSGEASYYYNENGTSIGAIGSGMLSAFHTPATAKYVDLKMGAQNDYIDYVMVEKGSSPSWIFEPYGTKRQHGAFFNSAFYGKKYVAIGDSNTDNRWYPAMVAAALGMYYDPSKTNVGGCECGKGGATYWMDAATDILPYSGSGSTTAICALSRVETLPIDADIIIMTGASNDAGQEKTIGAPEDITMYEVEGAVSGSTPSAVVHVPYTDVPANPNFYNCMAVSLNRVRERCPNADIFICEIPFRSMGAYETGGTVREDFFQPYREAQVIIAKKYGYPFIKTFQNLGLNELNWQDYLNHTDFDYGIHFNYEGNKLLASEMVAELLATRHSIL